MAISTEEIRNLIKSGKSQKTIQRAILHQNRIRFHAQTAITPYLCQPTTDFLAFVQNLIPADKFRMFKTLFRYPVKSTEVTSVCFDKLSRIFDGRNPAFNYQFATTEQRDDWEWYRQERLHEPEVWATRGWEYFKTEINSVLIIDCPKVQAGELPEPYFYWLPIQSVKAFQADRESGVMDWIAFEQGSEHIAVIDDSSYRIYRNDSGNIGPLISESPHDIGYCPARFFWNESINLHEPDVKASPLTKVLASLDWYLFYAISKQQFDLYGSYPILSGYAPDCDYEAKNGDHCDGGFLKNKEDLYLYDSAGTLMQCPKCGRHRIVGVGSFVEVPVPTADQPDMRNPVQMLTVDRQALDYNVAEEDRLRTHIIDTVVGTSDDVTAREALNEQQIRAQFESQSTILNRIKRGFEAAQQFVDETVCRLRYGSLFISARVNYGTEFYMFSVSELRERYTTAKENGASEAELDALHQQILETEYRHNPTQLQRMLILADLEPFQRLTRSEVMELHAAGQATAEDVKIKLNFTDYVKRFERENTNIIEFADAVPYTEKIKIIKNTFKEYANENNRGQVEGCRFEAGDG